jgi:hypothetical protein
VTKAFIRNDLLPNFDGKPRDISATMYRLEERVRLGRFLAERPEPPGQVGIDHHEQLHTYAVRWAKADNQEWCGRCQLGDDIWDRYEAGLLQPIDPVDVEAPALPKPKRFPELPIEGFIRAAHLREKAGQK